MIKQFFISIIIPVHNGTQYLDKCLSSIASSSYRMYETIVVDDSSIDNSVEIARDYGAIVLRLDHQSGPAFARNFGSREAKGEILLFIDSDIVLRKDTVARVANDFNENPDVVAVFGSYDDQPLEKDFFSQYKNLQQHFVHQVSSTEAVTFWAGCGAIRKDIFFSLQGFDENKYSGPCIEDIELGYRLKKIGHRILLDKALQVTHLKRWTFNSLLISDIFHRAIPWTKLILESQVMVSDLNLRVSQKVSTGLLSMIIVVLALSFIAPELIYLAFFLMVTILVINHRLFTFFLKRKGSSFALFAFAMYLLYYLYSGLTYISCWLLFKFRHSIKKE
jgi:glycosyltransferase involved in cell wall biosynthesis